MNTLAHEADAAPDRQGADQVASGGTASRTTSRDGTRHPAPPAGPVRAAWGVVGRPRQAMRGLAAHPDLSWAMGVVLLVGAVRGGMEAAGLNQPLAARTATDWSALGQPILLSLEVCVAAAVALGLGRLLGGSADLSGLATTIAFAQLATVLGAVLPLLVVLGDAGVTAAGLGAVAVTLWYAALVVIAVRESHGLPTGRALAVACPALAATWALARATDGLW